jgi:hypothetical protein
MRGGSPDAGAVRMLALALLIDMFPLEAYPAL